MGKSDLIGGIKMVYNGFMVVVTPLNNISNHYTVYLIWMYFIFKKYPNKNFLQEYFKLTPNSQGILCWAFPGINDLEA